VADPNWLLGVGLQRGWNSAFDAVFYADSLYNNKTFDGKPPNRDEPIEGPVDWNEHMDNMMNLMTQLGNAARESKLSSEMDTGMLEEKGPVVVQIRRELKSRSVEAPVPQYLPNVVFSNIHPLATRELAFFEHNSRYVDRGAAIKKKVTRPTAAMLTWPKRFDCSAFWGMMSLVEIDGKTAPGAKPLSTSGADSPPPSEPAPPKINTSEVKDIAMFKSTRLRESIVLQAMTGPAPAGLKDPKDRGAMDSLIFSAANRGRTMQREEDRPEAQPARAGVPRRTSAARDDLSAMNNVAAQLGGARLASQMDGDPDFRLKIFSYEKEVLKARLACAEKETEMIKKIMEEYERAEKKLKDME
jgi:hypothetical protein